MLYIMLYSMLSIILYIMLYIMLSIMLYIMLYILLYLNKVAATGKLILTAHSIIDCVDDSFWEAINVRTLGHKLLLARGILKL